MLNGTFSRMSFAFISIGKIKLVIKILKCLDWTYFYFHTIYQASNFIFRPKQYPVLLVSKASEVYLTLDTPLYILVSSCLPVNFFSCGRVVKDIS